MNLSWKPIMAVATEDVMGWELLLVVLLVVA